MNTFNRFDDGVLPLGGNEERNVVLIVRKDSQICINIFMLLILPVFPPLCVHIILHSFLQLCLPGQLCRGGSLFSHNH